MNTTTKATATDDSIASDIAQLRADLSHLSETVGKIGRKGVHGAAAAAGGSATEGLAAGEAALGDFAHELRLLELEIAASTRKNPWRALGFAAAVGFVLGAIIRR